MHPLNSLRRQILASLNPRCLPSFISLFFCFALLCFAPHSTAPKSPRSLFLLFYPSTTARPESSPLSSPLIFLSLPSSRCAFFARAYFCVFFAFVVSSCRTLALLFASSQSSSTSLLDPRPPNHPPIPQVLVLDFPRGPPHSVTDELVIPARVSPRSFECLDPTVE